MKVKSATKVVIRKKEKFFSGEVWVPLDEVIATIHHWAAGEPDAVKARAIHSVADALAQGRSTDYA